MYNALAGLVWGVGTVLGPLVGGGFAVSSATWRWSFYINLVLAAIVAPVFIFYLPSHNPRPKESVTIKLRHMALTFGGMQWAWDNYRFIVMIIFFGLTMIAFITTQYFTTLTTRARGVFPGHFLRCRSLVLMFFATSACTTSLFIGTYYIPLFFQFAKSDSAIMAAVRLLPFICVTITFVMLNGALMPQFGYYMPWYAISGMFLIIDGSLMYTIDLDTSPGKIYGYSVLVAVGCGSVLQSGYSIAAAKVEPEDVPAAIGYINIAQIGSIVTALTIAGSLFQNQAVNYLSAALGGFDFTDSEVRDAIAGTQSVVFQRGSEEVRRLAVQAIIKAMDCVFVLMIAAGAMLRIYSKQNYYHYSRAISSTFALCFSNSSLVVPKPIGPPDIAKNSSTVPILKAQ